MANKVYVYTMKMVACCVSGDDGLNPGEKLRLGRLMNAAADEETRDARAGLAFPRLVNGTRDTAAADAILHASQVLAGEYGGVEVDPPPGGGGYWLRLPGGGHIGNYAVGQDGNAWTITRTFERDDNTPVEVVGALHLEVDYGVD